MSKIKLWAIFTILAVAAAFGAGYFLVLSPQKADVAKAHKSAADVQSANDSLRTQVMRLKKEEKDLPAAQARIAAIEARIPSTPALPSYVRWLVTAAANAHVELVSLSPSGPSPLGNKAAAAVPAAPATSGGASGPAPAAPAAPASAALSGITVTYNVVGNYFAVQAFLKQLENSPRATVVSTITLAPGALPKGSGDTAPAAPGWQTLSAQVTATIFMSSVPAPTGAGTPTTTGTAGSGAAPATSAGSSAAPNS